MIFNPWVYVLQFWDSCGASYHRGFYAFRKSILLSMRSTITFFTDRQNKAKPQIPLQRNHWLSAIETLIVAIKQSNTLDKIGFDIKKQPKKKNSKKGKYRTSSLKIDAWGTRWTDVCGQVKLFKFTLSKNV